jgi:hypothetical protein
MSIRDPLHRKALACVMVSLSAGWFLRPASEVARDELRTAVAETFGKPAPLGRCPAVGRTLLSALGNPKLLMQEMGLTGPDVPPQNSTRGNWKNKFISHTLDGPGKGAKE